MDFAQIGNLLEAILWCAIGITVLVRSFTTKVHVRLLQILALSFIVFSLTDLIEVRTGAWWRPPWLLALKLMCTVTFGLCLRRYSRSSPGASRNAVADPPT